MALRDNISRPARITLLVLALVTALLLTACGSQKPAANPIHTLHSGQFLQQVEHPNFGASAYLSRPTAIQLVPGYDDVTLSSIPVGSSFTGGIGCYGVGSFANCGEARARFPHAHIVSITPTASGVAKVLDVEPGDAVPSQTPGWVRAMLRDGVSRPAIYSSSSEMGQVRADLSGAGFTHCTSTTTSNSCYLLWVAAWDGNSGIPFGYDAHQWFGGNVLDKDTFASYFFAAPKPPPPPNLPGCSTDSTATSHCYGRFPTIKLFNKTRGGWCFYGCVERDVVRAYDRDIFGGVNSLPALHRDEGRLVWLDQRLGYLIHHRSARINGDNYVYGREHEIYNRTHRHLVCSNWRRCDF